MLANNGGSTGCNYFLLENQTHLASSSTDEDNNNISHSRSKTHSRTLIQFLFWKTKKKCGSVIDSTMSLSEESDIWCVLQLELEILGQNWNKFDVSKIVFAFRKTLIWIQNSDISGILCCIKKSDIIDLISCNKTLTEFEGVGWKSLSQWNVAVPFWT